MDGRLGSGFYELLAHGKCQLLMAKIAPEVRVKVFFARPSLAWVALQTGTVLFNSLPDIFELWLCPLCWS